MVRTLDFQSKNVGSIPTNPTLDLNKLPLKASQPKWSSTRYSFFFASIISPHDIINVKLIFRAEKYLKKIYLKQSYIILTWFYHLTFIKKTSHSPAKIFILPIKRKKYTLNKSPMAHKNWSKEQFEFKFYLFRITFNGSLRDSFIMTSLNAAVLFVLLSKKHFPLLETNILFLKSAWVLFFTSDSDFFNFKKISENPHL